MKVGDEVVLDGKNYIIGDNYYPDGKLTPDPTAFVLYPPGKKNSYGHYFWAKAKDIKLRQ